jgi:hypothetical protein
MKPTKLDKTEIFIYVLMREFLPTERVEQAIERTEALTSASFMKEAWLVQGAKKWAK